MRSTSRHPAVALAALTAVALVAWWLLAPQAIGGSTAYLVVRGSSMSPGFGPGDLVVVREGPPYEPGEVVAYRTPGGDAGSDVGAAAGSGEGPVIVHRVVDVDGERLVLRGDANEVDDALRPSPDEVLGRAVVVVPGVGELVAGLRDHALAVTAVAVGALGGLAVMARPRRRRRVDAPVGTDDALVGAGSSGDVSAGVEDPAGDQGSERGDPIAALAVHRPGPPWLWLLLALVLAVGAVAVVRTPATEEQGVSVPWTVRTSFGWDTPPSGDPVSTAVYGEDGLRTGDTVFTSATPVLVVEVTSTLSTPSADPSSPGVDAGEGSAAGGSVVVGAEVVSDAGWRRTVAVLEPVSFEGGSLEGGWAAVELPVDLTAAWAAASATGSVAGRLGEVRLEVVATTTAVDGAVDATAVQTFVLDGVSAAPIPPEPGAGSGSDGSAGIGVEGPVGIGPTAAVADGGTSVEGGGAPSGAVAIDGAIETTEAVAAEVSLGPVTLSRTLAQVLVVTAGAVVLIGMIASVVATRRARRRGEASLLVTRHGGSLVPLLAAPASLGGDPAEVSSFAALRRVADTVGQPIGVTYVHGTATFWVTDGVRAWRYRASTG